MAKIKGKSKKLFMDDYLFTGSHEEKARKLTSEIDNSSGAKIFTSAVQLYMAAAVVGCHYGRRSPREKGDKTLRIMQNQFSNHYYDLIYIYKLVMLSEKDISLEPIDKINNAFKYYESPENMKKFEEYMLGGVDILYDKIFTSTNSSYDDFLSSINALMGEFKDSDKKDEVEIDFDSEVDF